MKKIVVLFVTVVMVVLSAVPSYADDSVIGSHDDIYTLCNVEGYSSIVVEFYSQDYETVTAVFPAPTFTKNNNGTNGDTTDIVIQGKLVNFANPIANVNPRVEMRISGISRAGGYWNAGVLIAGSYSFLWKDVSGEEVYTVKSIKLSNGGTKKWHSAVNTAGAYNGNYFGSIICNGVTGTIQNSLFYEYFEELRRVQGDQTVYGYTDKRGGLNKIIDASDSFGFALYDFNTLYDLGYVNKYKTVVNGVSGAYSKYSDWDTKKTDAYNRENAFNYTWVRDWETVITFDNPVDTSKQAFWWTDLYIPIETNGDVYPTYPTHNNADVNIATGKNFEIGTFLKNSIDAFMEVEFYNDFDFRDLFWLIIGGLAVVIISKLWKG